VLYETAMNKHTFEATSMADLMRRVMRAQYRPVASSFSQPFQALVTDMINVDAKRRPTTAQILQRTFVRRHVARYFSDIASRPDNVAGGIGEGTMNIQAAVKMMKDGGGGGTDNKAVDSLTKQLQALGLDDVVAQTMQKQREQQQNESVLQGIAANVARGGHANPSSARRPDPTAGGERERRLYDDPMQPRIRVAERAPVAAAAPHSRWKQQQPSQAAAAPQRGGGGGGPGGAAKGYHGNVARRAAKQQITALKREEERRASVETALARLREERRANLDRMQRRREDAANHAREQQARRQAQHEQAQVAAKEKRQREKDQEQERQRLEAQAHQEAQVPTYQPLILLL
jgi:hypothetical protein